MNDPLENVTDETTDCITNLMTNFSTGMCAGSMYSKSHLHLSSLVGTLCTVYTVHVHGKVTALGVLCCFAMFVCLTLLASFFHLSFKNMYLHVHVCDYNTIPLQLSIVLSYILFHLSL